MTDESIKRILDHYFSLYDEYFINGNSEEILDYELVILVNEKGPGYKHNIYLNHINRSSYIKLDLHRSTVSEDVIKVLTEKIPGNIQLYSLLKTKIYKNFKELV